MKLNKCCVAALMTFLSVEFGHCGSLKSAFVKDGASEHVQPGDKKEEAKQEDSNNVRPSTTTTEVEVSAPSDSSSAKEENSKEKDKSAAQDKVSKEVKGDPVAARIGKEEIRVSTIRKEIPKIPQQIVKTAKKEQLYPMVRDQLVTSILMERGAKKMGLHKDKEFLNRIEEIKRRLLTEAYIMRSVGAQAPSETELRARHAKYLIEFKTQKESHVFNIIVDSEKKAKEVIEKLKKGADFKKLIQEYSLYKDHADEGSWFVLDVLPPQLKEPLSKLKKGEFSKEPVKMGNLFAIFKIDDVRDSKPMQYEEAKGVISQLIMQEKLRDLILKLIKQYDVKVFKEDGSPDEFSMQRATPVN